MRKARKGDHPKFEEMERKWCTGSGIKKLSGEYNVPLGTLKNWHWKYEWSEKRKDFQHKITQTLFHKITEQMCKAAEQYMTCGAIISKMGLDSLNEILQGKDPKLEPKLEQIQKWTRVIKEGATIITLGDLLFVLFAFFLPP